MTADTAVLLVCAGNATRMGGIHKILHPLGNSTVLLHGLRTFCQCESVAELVVVCREQDLAEFQSILRRAALPLPVQAVTGGSTRQQSVMRGFAAVRSDCEYIAVHDGARPLVLPADIERVIADARECGAATLGVPVKDTVKVVRGGVIDETPDRALLWLTQTPQVFRRTAYAEAVRQAAAAGQDFTDDCQLMEARGIRVAMTKGDYSNIKLTTPEDFAVAEALLAARQKGRDDT
ncbi:MAG: 2-C-methyl-D-erythritol 4-phosphate cytidylyltransferase [Oscillospiraceae bacterium]|nr:2-C-methyl-D-erythritol 4-phosphate cytidylyltransferase [Oscillospiraceae bacterium]